MNQEKIFCRCIEGHCFLERDAQWVKQNHAQALNSNGISDHELFDTLDNERLNKKSEWMDSLGVKGTHQICCRHGTKEPHKKITKILFY